MSEIIGADAAKLAGLQIDLLAKYRDGSLNLDSLAWWLNLSQASRNAVIQAEHERFLAAKKVPAEKFELFADLGIITVPDGHVHEACLDAFFAKFGKSRCPCDKNITDANFSDPSRVLMPGDELRVQVFHQVVSGRTTSQERMAFLERRKEGNVYVGAQGITFVFEQKRGQLSNGRMWYSSFDQADRLWKDFAGYPMVPRMVDGSDADFHINLSYFGNDWGMGDAFFGFSEVLPDQYNTARS